MRPAPIVRRLFLLAAFVFLARACGGHSASYTLTSEIPVTVQEFYFTSYSEFFESETVLKSGTLLPGGKIYLSSDGDELRAIAVDMGFSVVEFSNIPESLRTSRVEGTVKMGDNETIYLELLDRDNEVVRIDPTNIISVAPAGLEESVDMFDVVNQELDVSRPPEGVGKVVETITEYLTDKGERTYNFSARIGDVPLRGCYWNGVYANGPSRSFRFVAEKSEHSVRTVLESIFAAGHAPWRGDLRKGKPYTIPVGEPHYYDAKSIEAARELAMKDALTILETTDDSVSVDIRIVSDDNYTAAVEAGEEDPEAAFSVTVDSGNLVEIRAWK